jgi:hypothetical protein
MTLKILITDALKPEGGGVVVYRGDKNSHAEFSAPPFFFVDDLKVAETYGPFLTKARVSMNNPIIFDFGGGSTYFLKGAWLVPSKLVKYVMDIKSDLDSLYALEEEDIEILERHGFSDIYGALDGIVIKNIRDAYDAFSPLPPATNYVVFDKRQIDVMERRISS